MHKCPKKWDQYTLVALVITIIILLILAGITISQLTGSGLFENAKLAEEKSKNAQEKEEGILDDYENKIGGYMVSANREETLKNVVIKNLMNEEVEWDITETDGWTTIKEEIELKESIKNYDMIYFVYSVYNSNESAYSRQNQQDYIVSTIKYNNSDTYLGDNTVLWLSNTVILSGNEAMSYGGYCWFKDDTTFYMGKIGGTKTYLTKFKLEGIYGISY